MHYALKSDYEDYRDIETADLPSGINRLLDRAEELIEQVSRGQGNPKQTDLEADASSGQKELKVWDANILDEGDDVTILDDDNSETGTIDSIDVDSYGDDTITLESNLTNSYTTAARAYVKKTNPDDWRLKQRRALRDATCAQVEYWTEAFGEDYDIAGSVESFAVGNLRMKFGEGGSGGGSTLAPRAYRHLRNAGMAYAGVGDRSSVVQDFIAGDPRID